MDESIHFAFLSNLYPMEILTIVFILICWIVPTWMILKKAGYHPAYSFLIIIPLINLGLIMYVAFAKWPIQKEVDYLVRQNQETGNKR
jgi:hypothetical protein